MSRNIGDRYFEDGIQYEVVDVQIATQEDGSIIAIENSKPVSY